MNVLIIISCICFLFIIGRIFIVPIKWIFKLLINSVLGGILICIINLIGANWGFHIGINIVTLLAVRNFGSTRWNIYNIIEDSYTINDQKILSEKLMRMFYLSLNIL